MITVSGRAAHGAALTQAYEQGERAKKEGKKPNANPYATEVPQWDSVQLKFTEGGETYCPTEEQRDAWNRGYGV